MSAVDPSLPEILEALHRTIAARIHTSIPAKVVSFNPATNTIAATIAIKDFVFDGDGDRTYDGEVTFPSVPVVWPRGGGYVLTLPLRAGDFVWLMFSERSLAEWRTTGQTSEPLDSRRLSLGYPVALPGAFPDVLPLSPEPTKDIPNRTTKMVLGKDGDPCQIVVDADPITPTISIGRDASDFVALASKVDAMFHAIATCVISAGDGGASIKAAIVSKLADIPTVAAAMTKAK